MRSSYRLPLGVLGSVVVAATFADAATITGTVTGPDGAPLRAAFVQARNAKTKITVSVLSDNQGHYRAENLAAGDYRVAIRAPGYRADPKNGVALAADQNATQDFKLQTAPVRWTDMSLLPGPAADAGRARQGQLLPLLLRLPWLRIRAWRRSRATRTAGARASTT